jgi:DNA helicase II / ATP-dependent DNA helicase PcrA
VAARLRYDARDVDAVRSSIPNPPLPAGCGPSPRGVLPVTPSLQAALAGLNPGQRQAVLHQSSPLLILAGAGSGKTRVITVKIAYLIDELGMDPRSILAVTFTNKAAGEMRDRAAFLVEYAREVSIRTFHSFGAWMLRRNADIAGLPRGFSIYDDDDSVALLQTIYPEHKRTTMARYARMISRAKDYCLTAEDDLSEISEDPEFPSIYRSYQVRLEEIGNVDFGDLIMRPVRLLDSEPAVARRLRSRFRAILVDEYQDSNVAQYRFLRALCDEDTFICVVGDDDQSIYRFRGAEVQNILTFPDIFPATRVVRLEQNYRSTAPILELAGAVVSRNEGRLGKELFTDRTEGEIPRLVLLANQDDEVDWTVRRVRQAEREDEEGITAVLYRTNAQSRAFETRLLREGIPYRIIGTLRFYEREEVKDAVAFLRFLANPRDEVSFRRVVNKPARGIGAKSLDRLLELRRESEGDLRVAADRALKRLGKKAAAGIAEFLRLIAELERLVPEGPEAGATVSPDSATAVLTSDAISSTQPSTLGDVVRRVIEDSGLAAYHREQDEIKGTQKLQNMEELANAASIYPADRDGLVEFLEGIELDSAREQESTDDARVVLITMHNTKGLEFDRVIITGLEEGLFPRGDDPLEIEEERRLFYVAITRAREEVTLTSCRVRRVHGKMTDLMPSRFLGEIPRELLQVDAEGYAAGGGYTAGGRYAAGGGYAAGGRYGTGGHYTAGGRYGPPPRESAPDHPWPPGTAVYHDSYGSGMINRAWYSDSQLCVEVRFETGMTGQFFPEYTPLERIAGGVDEWEDGW